jgi:hypothetical protein
LLGLWLTWPKRVVVTARVTALLLMTAKLDYDTSRIFWSKRRQLARSVEVQARRQLL